MAYTTVGCEVHCLDKDLAVPEGYCQAVVLPPSKNSCSNSWKPYMGAKARHVDEFWSTRLFFL